MSMPRPIHVALVGKNADQVREASKHFRLSAPGIGAAYLAAIDTDSVGKVLAISALPRGQIDLWLCLDRAALVEAEAAHQRDRATPRYGRGFYEEVFPEVCVLLESAHQAEQRTLLASWAQKVIDAWRATS